VPDTLPKTIITTKIGQSGVYAHPRTSRNDQTIGLGDQCSGFLK
jgi:hypothetical protein